MATYLLVTILLLLIAILAILIFRSGKNPQDIILHNKLGGVSQEISRLYEKLGGLNHESREILTLTRSFHDILKPTKTRGQLGESILENLLRDVLPKEVILAQYGFKDGKRIDFAIKLPAGIVPIDAKFSMDSFKNYLDASEVNKKAQQRSCIDGIKKRISETAEYIYPDEGTTDFALMYVPSEAVYYFIITETELIEFAQKKKIFIVGPSTLYAYLKTIFVGFQAMKIETRAKEIYANLKRLEKDVDLFSRDYAILGSHIKNISLKYDEVSRRMDRISLKLQNVANLDDENKLKSSTTGQETADREL